MLILALDTTTRAGSLAVARGETLVAAEVGDPARTHGERLPGDIIRLLSDQAIPLSGVDIFAVAAGPGSFTGLRIGIATMQGLALAHGKGLAAVSALDALALECRRQDVDGVDEGDGPRALGVWMDAQRQDVFAALYRASDLTPLDGPIVAPPGDVLARWAAIGVDEGIRVTGDGATRYRTLIEERGWTPDDRTPLVAPGIARLAARRAASGPVPGPGAVRPLYVRRPDAELARERARDRARR